MTLLLLCVVWVFASAGVAMLPMKRQYAPGVVLLLTAPVLIAMIWVQVGWIVAVLALGAFVSMFRNPLRYLIAKASGQNPKVPE